jgi:hypothetical protein
MRTALTTIASLALIGCSEITTGADPSLLQLPVPEQTIGTPAVTSRRLAAIDTQYLALPATARAGTAYQFELPVASGGCLGSDTTVTRVTSQRLTIWPYQQLFLNASCPAIYLIERRPVSVVLPDRGVLRLQIVTRNGPDGQFVVLERRVTVE